MERIVVTSFGYKKCCFYISILEVPLEMHHFFSYGRLEYRWHYILSSCINPFFFEGKIYAES